MTPPHFHQCCLDSTEKSEGAFGRKTSRLKHALVDLLVGLFLALVGTRYCTTTNGTPPHFATLRQLKTVYFHVLDYHSDTLLDDCCAACDVVFFWTVVLEPSFSEKKKVVTHT